MNCLRCEVNGMQTNDLLFNRIKEKTSGYLDVDIYKELYEAALRLNDEIIIDIGPAQGASTICFAMAAKKNLKIKTICSIDVFKGSDALKYKNSIEKNKKVIEDNLKEFDCENKVNLYEACNVSDAKNKCKNMKIGLIFIDADGNIDRDLLFWHKLFSENCIFIIDDVSNTFNVHSRNVYLKMQSNEHMNKLMERKGIKDIVDYPLLGRQYTIWALVEYLIKNDYITVTKIKGATLFAQIGNRVWNERIMKEEMEKIREKIYEKFERMNNKISAVYKQLEKPLRNIMNIFDGSCAAVYEFYSNDIKNKRQATQIYELGMKSETSAELHVLSGKDIEIVNQLLNGTYLESKNCEGSKLQKYLRENADLTFIKILLQKKLIGFIVLKSRVCIDHEKIRAEIEMITDILIEGEKCVEYECEQALDIN